MEPDTTSNDVSDELTDEQQDAVSGGVNQFRVIRPF